MSLNLVNYSSSDDEQVPATASKSKLPNPFGKPSEVVDNEEYDSAEHNGRVRTFPHERGNWATYVYIHYPRTDLVVTLQNELIGLIKTQKAFEATEFHLLEELHLSLTKTVVLHHHWIDEFVGSVEKSLKNADKFWMNFNSIQIYCNDNQTRTFISLSFVEKKSMAAHQLQYIVNHLDNCLSEFKLPPFYKEASFHVSLLWCLGDRRNELQALLPEFCDLLEHLLLADESNFTLNVEQLFCKIGNKLYSFHL